jgi:hypothetical protein
MDFTEEIQYDISPLEINVCRGLEIEYSEMW